MTALINQACRYFDMMIHNPNLLKLITLLDIKSKIISINTFNRRCMYHLQVNLWILSNLWLAVFKVKDLLLCFLSDHCMTNFVKPNLLGTRKEFGNRFGNPITNGQHSDSTVRDVRLMKRRAHVLHEMLSGCVQVSDYCFNTFIFSVGDSESHPL